MEPAEFIGQLDDSKIVDAIQHAERVTNAEVRVYVSHKMIHDALASAKKRFNVLGMEKTSRRNAVLVFVAPASQSFAVVGDVRVHEKLGEAFFHRVRDAMAEAFRRGDFTGGVVAAVGVAAGELAQEFPRKAGDKNELPDEVAEGRRRMVKRKTA